MRTTLELDDDLALAGKRMAEQRKTSPRVKNGVPLFRPRPGAMKANLDLVNRLRDAE